MGLRLEAAQADSEIVTAALHCLGPAECLLTALLDFSVQSGRDEHGTLERTAGVCNLLSGPQLPHLYNGDHEGFAIKS